MSRRLVQGLAEVDRPAHVDQEGMSACSIHSPVLVRRKRVWHDTLSTHLNLDEEWLYRL